MASKTRFLAVFLAIFISSAVAKKDQSDRIKIGECIESRHKNIFDLFLNFHENKFTCGKIRFDLFSFRFFLCANVLFTL